MMSLRHWLVPFAVVLLAGCASSPDLEAESATGDTADPADTAVAPVRYESQELGRSTDFVATPASGAWFDIEVPEGTVDLTVSFDAMPYAGTGVTVRVDDCGEATFDAVVLGGMAVEALLCEAPPPGTLRVDISITAGALYGDAWATGSVPTA